MRQELMKTPIADSRRLFDRFFATLKANSITKTGQIIKYNLDFWKEVTYNVPAELTFSAFCEVISLQNSDNTFQNFECHFVPGILPHFTLYFACYILTQKILCV